MLWLQRTKFDQGWPPLETARSTFFCQKKVLFAPSYGAKCTQIDEGMCQGVICTCQNFFLFTNLPAGVTFLRVIFQFPKKVLNRSFLISLAVFSYLSPPIFLTTLPHHCYIPQHCLSLHGGYWCKKERDLVRVVVFSVPVLYIFLSVIDSVRISFKKWHCIAILWHCGSMFCFLGTISTGVSWHSLHCCHNNLAHFYCVDTAFSLVEPKLQI